MISKDELVRNVAEKCGVALEISSFFFEVFINRISNKLKPGEIIQFDNFGYFHKRNCRIHLEKSSDSPAAKAYLLQLVLFSLEPNVKSDLTSVHFLKIPNLKSLWIDDKEFQNSLKAGDFAPYTERDQLIKAFATKAEVIISGLRKDYDSELENELTIPLTFDLNFLIKSGQKSASAPNKEFEKVDSKLSNDKKDLDKASELNEDGLPWNYGTKFLEKNKGGRPTDDSQNIRPKARIDQEVLSKKDSDIEKDKDSKLNNFEPVRSRLSNETDDNDTINAIDTIKFNLAKAFEQTNEKSTSNTFTEVRSKTGARLPKEIEKNKKSRSSGRLSETRLKYQGYAQSRNYLPMIILLSFVVIAAAAIYFYFFSGNGVEATSGKIVYDIKPPSNVNLIERDFDFAVTYPYPKIEGRIKVSGYNPDAFLVAEVKPEIIPNKKSELKPEVKPIVKSEKTNTDKEKPKTEEKSITPKEEKLVTTPDLTEQKSSRIFLYKNFYVVYVGNFNSSEVANREADKYSDLGYNAFIEVLEGRNGKSIYKLNVGDFTSEEFARDFESKYLKK
jgi:cell division septation protein DedD